MSKRTKKKPAGSGDKIRAELVDQLLKEHEQGLSDPQALLKDLTAAVINRAMTAEMDHHLGYDHGAQPPEGQSNRRNGTSSKRVRTEQGEVDIMVPRDREGSFEPQLIGKHERQFGGFDDKILAMYARGMTVRDIRAHLEELYGVEVSPELISKVTDGVVDELTAWRRRPLERVYCIVYLDALMVKIRSKGSVSNQAVYVAVGVPTDGCREVLGLWVQDTEGAKFWSAILDELRRRGVEDILVLCSDGLSGMSQAVEANYPQAVFQTCIVHVVRSSTRFVTWAERRAVCADLKTIYNAVDEEAAEQALTAFEQKWNERFPTVARAWRQRWSEITPFLAFPEEIRRAIYTTNAVEALNRILRKALKTRGHMPNEQAALKLLYLALRHERNGKVRRARSWTRAMNQFAIHFEGRLPA